MPRAFIILLDSFGIGATADAPEYHDVGADTFRHIAEYCAKGLADRAGQRTGPLHIPTLLSLGLAKAAELSGGAPVAGLASDIPITAKYGCAEEISLGKDTPSGHWELMGVPVRTPWGYFAENSSCFPAQLLQAFIETNQLPGILGNCHASGTEIIKTMGEEHEKTGKPIVYTSADSVFQIAAHEQSFGLDHLYAISESARKLVDEYNIGRVIARPFLGKPGGYYRTGNRRDYSLPPPAPTLLDHLVRSGKSVIAIGKVADIFAHQGITRSVKADGNVALFETFLHEAKTAPDGCLVFVNLVDFDMVYGHRRDVAGYAHALEIFDRQLQTWPHMMRPGDMCVITADHGCDPTWPGSDHTRENIPVLLFGPGITGGSIGKRKTFADVGQTLAQHLGLPPLDFGTTLVPDDFMSERPMNVIPQEKNLFGDED